MREISYKSPLYIQLREVIRSKIEEEEYLPGTAIPSENQLMETYGLNRVSVRSALAALEELYIPYSVVPGLEEVDIKLFSIYDIYQWNGIVLGEGHQTLRITRLPPMLAKHMDVPPEQAVMEFSCTPGIGAAGWWSFPAAMCATIRRSLSSTSVTQIHNWYNF